MSIQRLFPIVPLGAVALVGALLVGNVRVFHFSAAAPAMASMEPAHMAPGTRAAFTYLAAQRSNTCGLQPRMVMTYPASARIQGSCCRPMDWSHYQAQVRGLRIYSGIRQIPPDPYDISAALANELFADEASISLTTAQQTVYDNAMRLSPEKGPCCCTCWRWHAFAGLAKYLIAGYHFEAPRVASVIGLVDGCGGK